MNNWNRKCFQKGVVDSEDKIYITGHIWRLGDINNILDQMIFFQNSSDGEKIWTNIRSSSRKIKRKL